MPKGQNRIRKWLPIDNDSCILIPLGASAGVAIIDKEMYSKVADVPWHLNRKHGYVCSRKNRRAIRLNRVITDCPDGMDADHINGNKLDNRLSNLRICTHQQNCFNRAAGKNNKSGILGVSFSKKDKKWCADIKIDYKGIHLGRFDNMEDAIKCRKNAEISVFGEFRRKSQY